MTRIAGRKPVADPVEADEVGAPPPVVEWDRQGLRVNGSAVPRSRKTVRLECRGWNDYRPAEGERTAVQNLVIDQSGGTVDLAYSKFGEWPLAYYVSAGRLILGPSPEGVRRALQARSPSPQPDRIGILESLLLDCPLRHRTLFAGIHKPIPGDVLRFDVRRGTVRRRSAWILPFSDASAARTSHAKLLGEACELLESLWNRSRGAGGTKMADAPLTVPLSGGLDSRLLLGLLCRERVAVQTVSFGSPRSVECVVARKVAAACGASWRQVVLQSGDYGVRGAEVARLTGGMSSGAHSHLYAVLSRSPRFRRPLVHGYLGDVYAGDSQPDVASRFPLGKGEAADAFVAARLAGHPLWRSIPLEDRDGIRADLEAALDDCCLRNLPCHFDEYIHNVDRQSGLIAWVFAVCELHAPLIRPFANPEYAEFFNALPFELRSRRRLFRDAARRICPDLFRLPESRAPYSSRIPRAVQSGYLRLRNLLHRGSAWATRDHWVLESPGVVQRFDRWLRGPLRDELGRGASLASDLLDIDLSQLARVGWRDRIPYTQFRLLALANLFSDSPREGAERTPLDGFPASGFGNSAA